MKCGIVTLFPDMFQAITNFGITGRAVERGLLNLEFFDPRAYAKDKHKTVDDRPYGGGPGMVMSVYPLRTAIQAARLSLTRAGMGEGIGIEAGIGSGVRGGVGALIGQPAKVTSTKAIPAKVIYVSPQGRKIDHNQIKEWSLMDSLIFVAGRYEGIDERLIKLEIDEEWSIGDYVLSGGELAIMVIIDAITRLIPDVLGHELSAEEDSFSKGLLDYPHYTRPHEVDGLMVPEVLMGGDHKSIDRWRLKQSLGRTWQRRPDLLEKLNLSSEQKVLLKEFIEELSEESSGE